MIKFKYEHYRSSLGSMLRPMADIILQVDSQKVEVTMLIDSGADITMIPFRFGKALGLKQTLSDKIMEIKGVSGSGVSYILKKVTLRINGKLLNIRLAWALIEEVPLLLGRMDIFNKFKITFDENKGLIIFSTSP